MFPNRNQSKAVDEIPVMDSVWLNSVAGMASTDQLKQSMSLIPDNLAVDLIGQPDIADSN